MGDKSNSNDWFDSFMNSLGGDRTMSDFFRNFMSKSKKEEPAKVVRNDRHKGTKDKENYYLVFDFRVYERETVQVSVEENVIVVKAHTDYEHKSILPKGTLRHRITARMDNGFLLITMPYDMSPLIVEIL